MDALNTSLFLWLNASANPSAGVLAFAKLFADYAIALVPAVLVMGWLRAGELTRKHLLLATVAGLAALLINQVIGLVWQHPRPFMIGLGHTYIPHAADSSFPSDHLTLLWAVAFSLLPYRTTRRVALALTLLGIPMAWARIYLGVHFPMDMLGAALVALLSAVVCSRGAPGFIDPVYRLVYATYRPIFASLIRRGWVLK